MSTSEPLPLSSSWPLWEQQRHFELGSLINCGIIDALEPASTGELGLHHVGCWECDLADNKLTWSGGVYDIFGLERGAGITRDEILAFYCEESRAKMERLRSYALKHRRGFTLDVEISAAIGERRWMRLVAAPACASGRPVRLRGLKLII